MKIEEILKLPLVDLKDKIDGMSITERGALANDLSGLTSLASLMAGYVEERYGYGCGDQGHKDAVKRANRVRKQVRKALGFHITNDISF